VLEKRTELVAQKVTQFLKATDRFHKTILFCENIDHAERMRQALVNTNGDRAAANSRYVMRITGDNDEGKAQLDNFIDPESAYPVIATEVASMRPRDRALSTAGGGDVLANPHNAHGPHARL
jgi:type I restriction enzyme, R subunit